MIFFVAFTFYTFFCLVDLQGRMLDVHSTDPGTSSRDSRISELKYIINHLLSHLRSANATSRPIIRQAIEANREELRDLLPNLPAFIEDMKHTEELLRNRSQSAADRVQNAQRNVNYYMSIDPKSAEHWKEILKQTQQEHVDAATAHVHYLALMAKWKTPEKL